MPAVDEPYDGYSNQGANKEIMFTQYSRIGERNIVKSKKKLMDT